MATRMKPTTSSTKPTTTIAITSFAHNPLTTAFSRPNDCHGIYRSGHLVMMDLTSTCLPSSLNTKSDSYFSPGISCPSGYVTACHDNKGIASITTVTCCPTFNRYVTLSCVTTSTLKSVWTTLFCTWIAPAGRDTSLFMTLSDNGVTSTVERGFRSPAGLNAFGIRMVYQQTDVSARHSHHPAPTTTSSSEADAASSSDGLSTGSKVAIGIAVPIFILLLLLLAMMLLWRRRRRRYRQDPSPTQPHEKHTTQELHGENVQEMMGSTADVAELPVTSTQR